MNEKLKADLIAKGMSEVDATAIASAHPAAAAPTPDATEAVIKSLSDIVKGETAGFAKSEDLKKAMTSAQEVIDLIGSKADELATKQGEKDVTLAKGIQFIVEGQKTLGDRLTAIEAKLEKGLTAAPVAQVPNAPRSVQNTQIALTPAEQAAQAEEAGKWTADEVVQKAIALKKTLRPGDSALDEINLAITRMDTVGGPAPHLVAKALGLTK